MVHQPTLGYLFDFAIHKGSTGLKTDNITNLGLDAGVMLDIIDDLPVDSDDNLKTMLLSVDNFFNSFQLTDHCSLRNIKQERCSEGGRVF